MQEAFLRPPTIQGASGGRPAIDYDALYEKWRNNDVYIEIPEFLAIYGIDYRKRRAKQATKNWQRREVKVNSVESPTWDQVLRWRAVQLREDYRISSKLRELIENRTDQFQEAIDSGRNVKTHDLVNLAKACEMVQRVQRLCLGLSTDNVGIDKVEKEEDNTPTFIVEMEENGKFKTQRPRKVNAKEIDNEIISSKKI